MRNDRENSQEFYFNDKPVSPWVAWPVIASVLLLAIIMFVSFAATFANPAIPIALLLAVSGLPLHLMLRLFGRRGIYDIERTEWVPVFDGDTWDDDESENDRNRFSIGAGEWRRSFTFGWRPWREAIMRR